jgi:phospholipid transport system substrate-binding protein
MLKKLIVVLAFCLALPALAPAASAQQAQGGPAEFITKLGDRAVQILRASPGAAERKTQFSQLFTDGFDVPAIGKFVLGHYWREATPEQQQEYLKLFGQYVVAIYADRFSNYQGETFKVVGAKPDDGGTSTVASEIERPNGGPPIHIDWRVAQESAGYKIIDVKAENLSMSVAQREEFASVIAQHGGNVQGLIDVLKQKVGAGVPG